MTANTFEEDVIVRLTKDLKEAVTQLTPHEVRFLVDAYYQMQDNRIRADGQLRALSQGVDDAPKRVLDWLSANTVTLEGQIRKALDLYSTTSEVGRWSRTICGIGPVIASGLVAHIDITKAPTVGHIWRFAGLDPTDKWDKGQKRPWNAQLKVICWKAGESFVKVSANGRDVYGKIYLQRKAYEEQKNAAGEYAAQAAIGAARVGKTTEAWKSYSIGKLPLGHLHARAKRYAVKLFLSHWHEVAYRAKYGTAPPLPYPIAILGHAHKVEVPMPE